MEHVIKKQVIDCVLYTEQGAFGVQHRVSNYYKQILLPVLEKVFDELSDEESLIYLDHLEIDLGFLSEKVLQQQYCPEEFSRKFFKQIKEEIARRATGKTLSTGPSRIGIFRQWLFYMQHGYLDWNTAPFDEVRRNAVLEALATDYNSIDILRKEIAIHPYVATRIVRQHKEPFLIALIEAITALKQELLPLMLDELVILIRAAGDNNPGGAKQLVAETKEHCWIQSLHIAAAAPSFGALQISEKLLLLSWPEPAQRRKRISKKISSIKLLLPLLEKICPEETDHRSANTTSLQDEDHRSSPTMLDKAGLTDADPSQVPAKNSERFDKKTDSGKGSKKQKGDTLTPGKPGNKKDISTDTPVVTGDVYVQFAGLVVVHSFLPSLFKKLELVKDGRFTGQLQQQKAICLLHYLATGSLIAEEHQLVLPKFLCAFPVGQPIVADAKLSVDELEEADHMLEAVISHWTALKQTSAAGLREGFLQRNGKLYTQNDKWYLQVECNTIDVLLDRLPWNLSLVKLPWMKDLLRVEWR